MSFGIAPAGRRRAGAKDDRGGSLFARRDKSVLFAPAMSFTLSALRPDENSAVADLLHRSLVNWYESRLRQGARFGDSPEPFRLIPETYAALDPGEAIAARDAGTQALLGVCFVHPRESHYAVGIVASAPEAAGRGVARAMMEEAIRRARVAGLPVRLVSSLLNLDSFSLYTRLGFVPGTVFQDLLFHVPAAGLAGVAPAGIERVREARADEAAALADYEAAVQGLRRESMVRSQETEKPVQGLWRQWNMLSHEGSLSLQTMRWRQHLPTWHAEKPLQRMRRNRHLPAWSRQKQVQGVLGRKHVRSWTATVLLQGMWWRQHLHPRTP